MVTPPQSFEIRLSFIVLCISYFFDLLLFFFFQLSYYSVYHLFAYIFTSLRRQVKLLGSSNHFYMIIFPHSLNLKAFCKQVFEVLNYFTPPDIPLTYRVYVEKTRCKTTISGTNVVCLRYIFMNNKNMRHHTSFTFSMINQNV